MATPTAEHMAKLPPIVEMPEEDWEEEPSFPMDHVPEEEKQKQAAAKAEEEGEEPVAEDTPETPLQAEGTETPPADTEGEQPEAEASEQPDASDMTTKAKAWEAMEQSFARNPVAFLQQLRNVMTPEQQADFDRQFAPPAPPQPQWDQSFRADEDLTAEELFVKHQAAPALQRVQQFQSDVTGWTQQAADVFNQQAQAIQQLSETLTALQTELAAVKGAQAKASVRVPRTPRNGAGAEPQSFKISDEATMPEIFNMLKRRAGRT